jgi:hypothetical protein
VDERGYQQVLMNWRYRIGECRRLQEDTRARYGPQSPEHRRALALLSGYRAALAAARLVEAEGVGDILAT